MNSLAIKRILRDIMVLKKEPLNDTGIYINWNENDIKKVKACIIGPEDTPYCYGYYFFDITFPDDYPHKPPKVIYQTREGMIRFNPNLYACGKVCVSILGTWSGPQWTSCQSLRSILLSLQTLLNDKPIQNEPGFEKEEGIKNTTYNKIIFYQNFRVAIIKMLNFPNAFSIFLPIMRDLFIKNYSKIIENMNKQEKLCKNKPTIISPIYGMTVKINYEKLKKNIELLFQTFTSDSNILGKIEVQIKDEIKKEIIKKKKRQAPNFKAKNYENGFIKKSENNNKDYVVYSDKNGIKKWKLKTY